MFAISLANSSLIALLGEFHVRMYKGFCMHAEEAFHQVLSEFVALTGGDPSALEDGAEVSFEFDGMLAFIFAHPTQDALVIDIEVMQLRDPRAEPANLERFMLLHQLNGVTRFTHGAQALVSVDNMLIVSQCLPLQDLKGGLLSGALDQMLDVASDLRSMWADLRTLIDAAGQSLQSIEGSSAPVHPANFA